MTLKFRVGSQCIAAGAISRPLSSRPCYWTHAHLQLHRRRHSIQAFQTRDYSSSTSPQPVVPKKAAAAVEETSSIIPTTKQKGEGEALPRTYAVPMRRWSAPEVALLTQMRIEKRGIQEMSTTFNRTENSIVNKLRSLVKYDTTWTTDKILKAREQGLTWQQLGDMMPLYSISQIRRRFRILQQQQQQHGEVGASGQHKLPKKSPVRFSPEDDRQIVDLRERAVPLKQIAKLMGGNHAPRTIAGRYRRLVRLGLVNRDDQVSEASRNVKDGGSAAAKAVGDDVEGKSAETISRELGWRVRVWDKEENELLVKLLAAGKTRVEIAKTMGRSFESIKGRIAQLHKLHRDLDGKFVLDRQARVQPRSRRWSEADLEKLKKLHREGCHSIPQIAQILDRTQYSIRHKYSDLRLNARDSQAKS